MNALSRFVAHVSIVQPGLRSPEVEITGYVRMEAATAADCETALLAKFGGLFAGALVDVTAAPLGQVSP